ncbi:MAG: DNA-3-methyladenine glycosylase I [Paraglaciecola sp.]|uniref:DNA-3-methyladenine glycosylase I n=1 Tax=Paraglaciecola sp. TaxID=1920173 RepID=UPI00273F35BD|nr:DNA-3-methyladenine glycosylase I [Paraglaciecola sp.]MDP5029909.1 DNA-3-methyladenine glycosylase I [Paraglaciecola sp.]MDP5040546.1 DNA-3-methyladenine glycosylase I [Paraglaciecola sp.]MDP5133989.1 DNA-3-methyladenine glycosylase I [Paraglaciecola sp.]
MQKLEKFQAIYQRACERKGGPKVLDSLLSKPLSDSQLAKVGDDRFLAELTKKVFQSGFVWRVVRNKWPDFERVFWQFDIDKLLMMPDEMLESKAQDPAIIRNFSKVKTIRENALMIDSIRREHGSFAKFIAQWPTNDIIGLWHFLKKSGARLGGNTGPYALRALGKDTFLLTRDIEMYFRQRDVISGGLQTKGSLNAIQHSFNELQQQSGRSLQEISIIIANSVGDNYA